MNVNIKNFQTIACKLLPAPQARTITSDISVNDLKLSDHASALNDAINAINRDWAELDARYASRKVKRPRVKPSGSQLLCLPQNIDYTSLETITGTASTINNWHHPRIPADCEGEYFSCLRQLFQRLENTVADTGMPPRLQMQDVMNIKTMKDIRGFMKKPNYKPAQICATKSFPLQRVSTSDVVITVSITSPSTLSPFQTFEILGSQTLAHLRDVVYCLHDHVSYGNSIVDHRCSLFCDNVVYVDTRAVDIDDYGDLAHSQQNPAMDSASTSPDQLVLNSLLSISTSPTDTPLLTVIPMHTTTLNSLTLTLGKCYYLLHHHKSCVHHVYFTDVTLYNSKYDAKYVSDYPLLLYQNKLHRRKCGICNILPANYCTFGDRLVDKSPYYFCQACYHMLHYDCEGKLIYDDFAVFPYYHDTK